MKFENIIGHNSIKEDILRNLEADNLNHAMLFSGIGGLGKKFLARTLAKSILCSGHEKPCNTCESCIQFDSNNNPDYLFITSEKGSIKKQQVVDFIDFLSIRPFNSKYKVAIIEHFEEATVEAQNSILKTLEEPPSYAKIILLSENDKKLLDTVLSRVKQYKFHPISKLTLIEYFINEYNMDDKEAGFYADFSNGSIGKALKYIENPEFRDIRTKALDIFDNALKGQRKYVIENLDFFEGLDDINSILDLYLTWLRDLLVIKTSKDTRFIYNTELISKLNSQKYLNIEIINRIKEMIIQLKDNLNRNISEEFSLELFFIEVMEECNWKE